MEIGVGFARWEARAILGYVGQFAVADLLEQDRHAYYPDEPPVIDGTFEQALLDLITQK